MKSEKELQVIEAAYKVFFRYGYARTTMADLAGEAGLSRPALYLVYSGKAEVFQAVMEWMTDAMLERIASTMDADWPLGQKLVHVMEIAFATPYEQVKAHPDAQDLLALDSQVAGYENAYRKLQVCLVALLDEAVRAAGIGAGTEEVARTLLAAMRGFKLAAVDSADLRRLIALQVDMLVAALGQAPAGKNEAPARKARRKTA